MGNLQEICCKEDDPRKLSKSGLNHPNGDHVKNCDQEKIEQFRKLVDKVKTPTSPHTSRKPSDKSLANQQPQEPGQAKEEDTTISDSISRGKVKLKLEDFNLIKVPRPIISDEYPWLGSWSWIIRESVAGAIYSDRRHYCPQENEKEGD